MKKAKLMLIFAIICFAFIPRVFATNYMSVSKNNVKVNEEFEISVVAENIKGWNIKVTPTDNASDCSIEANVPVSDETMDGVASKTCTINNAGTASFTLTGSITTIGTDEAPDGDTIELNETIEITIAAEENPKGLLSLNINGGTLRPSFDSDNLENTGYTIMLNSSDTTSFSINAVAKTNTDGITAERAISGNSENYEPISLSDINFTTAGNNSTMLIRINVGEGERLVQYEIQVVRPTQVEPPELARLRIDGEDITLVSGVYKYEITLDEKESYFITATIKDNTNYMFNEFLTPPVEISSKEFELGIVPKDPTAGLSSAIYHIIIKTNDIEPITNPPQTTTKSGGNGGGNIENPQTGTPVYIVAIILVSSLLISMYLYKKNINGYN